MKPTKRTTLEMPAVPGCPGATAEVSVEAVLQAEVAELGKWLAEQGLDVGREMSHVDEGSRDRLFWRYGYFAGLKQALEVLAGRHRTLH
jgi:hypothetical protein